MLIFILLFLIKKKQKNRKLFKGKKKTREIVEFFFLVVEKFSPLKKLKQKIVMGVVTPTFKKKKNKINIFYVCGRKER